MTRFRVIRWLLDQFDQAALTERGLTLALGTYLEGRK